MATLNLLGLTCVRTQEGKDEPYLKIFSDGEQSGEWGWERMEDGQTIHLDLSVNYDTRAEIQLWENDRRRDDLLGSLMLSRAYEGLGEFRSHIYRHRAHYYVTFEVTETTHRPENFTIELIRLECNDAQQYKDYPYLKINGEPVWGPTRMRTGDILDVGVSRPFHRNVFVDLWEQDRRSSDHFGTMVLLLREVQEQVSHGPLPFTFRADDGIVGDATYTLTYDLHPG